MSTASLIRSWERTLQSIKLRELSSDELSALVPQLCRALDESNARKYSPEWNAAEERRLLMLLGRVQKALPLSAWLESNE